jgi:hypothetical protein
MIHDDGKIENIRISKEIYFCQKETCYFKKKTFPSKEKKMFLLFN